MARIRTIKPELPQSESMGRVSREARLLFIQLFTLADDEGRARAASRLLASLLYPYDRDAGDLIDGWLGELERERSVRLYEVDGNRYLQIEKWLTHQKIDKPTKSRLPAPPAANSRTVAKPREVSSGDLVPSILDLGEDLGARTKKDSSAVPKKMGTAQAVIPAEPFVVMIPTNRFETIQEEVGFSQAKLDQWATTYPGVDVAATMRVIRQWSIDNKSDRKTVTGMNRFINSWLAREQNRGGNKNGSQRTHPQLGAERNSRFLQGIAAGVAAASDET